MISLFSDAYDDVVIDTWSASWDQADVEDIQVAGNPVKKYTNLAYAGIEFTSQPINATSMTDLHVDLWTNDPSAFRIKLVDLGATGLRRRRRHGARDHPRSGLDATHRRRSLEHPRHPALGLHGLVNRGNLAQMIISGASPTVYLDNIYFFSTAPPSAERAHRGRTDADARGGNVVSLFSDAYTDATVDTWSASWDQADVEDVQIAGDAVKKYTSLVFAGIEFTSTTVDASAATHFHFDVWTPDPTAAPPRSAEAGGLRGRRRVPGR